MSESYTETVPAFLVGPGGEILEVVYLDATRVGDNLDLHGEQTIEATTEGYIDYLVAETPDGCFQALVGIAVRPGDTINFTVDDNAGQPWTPCRIPRGAEPELLILDDLNPETAEARDAVMAGWFADLYADIGRAVERIKNA